MWQVDVQLELYEPRRVREDFLEEEQGPQGV